MATKVATHYVLKLYITGNTLASQAALQNLQQLLDTELRGRFQLKVVDLREHPQLAEEEKILATPTLARMLPEPVRRIIGDLSDRQRVLLGLDLFTS